MWIFDSHVGKVSGAYHCIWGPFLNSSLLILQFFWQALWSVVNDTILIPYCMGSAKAMLQTCKQKVLKMCTAVLFSDWPK